MEWSLSLERTLGAMERHLEAVEPALSYARAQLTPAKGATPPAGETALLEAIRALRACRAYLTAHRPPVYATVNPRGLMEACRREVKSEHFLPKIEPVGDCVYDLEQTQACVEAVLSSIRLDEDSRLWIELFEDEDVPQIAVSLDGPGRVPARMSFDGFAELSFEAFETRWTVATRGGRIDKIPNGLALRLKGIRDPRESVEGLEPLIEAVAGAERDARAALRWAGIASESKGTPSDEAKGMAKAIEAGRAGVDAALAIVDGPQTTAEPADMTAILADVETEFRELLHQSGIQLETLCDAQTPPIALHRRSIAAFFRAVLNWGVKALPDGGLVTLLMDYDLPHRAVSVVTSFGGPTVSAEGAFYEASLWRAVVERHAGALQCMTDDAGITLSATLPDRVGKELAEWIPGFERFTERSRKMLRLLKGSRQAALHDVIMPGVLEEELERWLLPRLEEPGTIHLARDLEPENRGLPGTSPERLEKALGQVQRGKPRKEICKPQYAGELFWAFRVDERHKAALGLERFEQGDLKRLCIALLQNPTDVLTALRIMALYCKQP